MAIESALVVSGDQTYEAGQTLPLTQDTAGRLRITPYPTGCGYDSSATITRPANQTPYTAGDTVGGAITFTSAGPVLGGSILVNSVELEVDIAAIPTGMTSFRLYLYSVTPPSATADNAAWDLPSGDRASFLGYVDLGTPVDLGSTLYVRTNNVQSQFVLASGSVYGYLVTNGGFTPAANSEVYKVKLHSVAF